VGRKSKPDQDFTR